MWLLNRLSWRRWYDQPATGGQALPDLDWDLGVYVAKSFVRNAAEYIRTTNFHINDCEDYLKKNFIKPLDQYLTEQEFGRILNTEGREIFDKYIQKINEDRNYSVNANYAWKYACTKTDRDVYQAMESLIHNFSSLQSRSGNQVPFSSVNFGLDTSEEGRMISRSLMANIEAGLGHGETAIFPIAIMKLKKGITDKGSKNYDLFKQMCKVSAKRLYPNFINVDAPFNLQYYKEGRPETHVSTINSSCGF